MTQKEFKTKLNDLFTSNGIRSVNVTNVPELGEISVLWSNPQQDEINDERVEEIGLDNDNFLYIIFSDSGCAAWEDDLDINRDFIWDNIFDVINKSLTNK